MDVDLKLMILFEEVFKTGSVSRAAENIGANQPSVSIGLAKLRRYFNDPLFVRTSRGMEPTPHAEEIIKPIREAIALLRSTLGHQIVFEPLTSNRKFRIAMTDISQIVMLPAPTVFVVQLLVLLSFQVFRLRQRHHHRYQA